MQEKTHDKAMHERNIEINKLKIIEAEAEVYVTIVMKEEHDKEIERDKHEQRIKTLMLEHNQALKIKQPTKNFGHVKSR